MDHRPKWRAKIVKLLGRNIGLDLYKLGWSNSFLDIPNKHTHSQINWTTFKFKTSVLQTVPSRKYKGNA